MIGRIAGILIHRAMDHVMIDVHGVGYIVHISTRTAQSLPRVGEACALYTELLVREDLLQLFGFSSLVEKEWHRLLTSVQGIGAKAALAILGTVGSEGVGRAIALGDWNTIRMTPGVGPKLAQRVVMELKGKAPTVMAMGGPLTVDAAPTEDVLEPTPKPVTRRAAPTPTVNYTGEAMSALTNLGYAPSEAAAAVAEAAEGPDGQDTARLIRAALRLLAPKD